MFFGILGLCYYVISSIELGREILLVAFREIDLKKHQGILSIRHQKELLHREILVWDYDICAAFEMSKRSIYGVWYRLL